MSYDYNVKGYYKIKHKCKLYPRTYDPNNTIELYDWDILFKSEDGTYGKHTGICMLGFMIPEEDIERIDESVTLRMM